MVFIKDILRRIKISSLAFLYNVGLIKKLLFFKVMPGGAAAYNSQIPKNRYRICSDSEYFGMIINFTRFNFELK